MLKGKGVKRALKIVLDVILCLIVAVCLMMIILTVFSKRSKDGAVNFFGKELRIVETASMEKNEETDVSSFKIKNIPTGSMIFIETVPKEKAEADEWYSSLKVGDVLTFKYYIGGAQNTITHRIIDIKKNDGEGYTITLRGDNVNVKAAKPGGITEQRINTGEESFSYVIGKVTGQSTVMGFLITAFKKPLVMGFIVILPCVAIIVFEVIRIISVVKSSKKEKAEREKKDKDDEIESLRKQIEELKKKQEQPETEKE